MLSWPQTLNRGRLPIIWDQVMEGLAQEQPANQKEPTGMNSYESRCWKGLLKNVTNRPSLGQPANQKEAKNIRQHGGYFEKLIAWVFVNHHEDVIYKKLHQSPMICFPAVGHFENSCQHFEKLIAWVFVNHHEDVQKIASKSGNLIFSCRPFQKYPPT